MIPAGRPTRAAAEEFGRRLTVLHAAGADAFGSPPPGGPADALIGRAPMRNVPAPSWPAWYARDRVLPYVRAARDAGTLDAAEVAVLERAAARVAAPAEPPARLHGDLWSGNVLWAPDGAWLIDPAAHGGHRETDLAMLALFGCPHLDRVLAAYDEAAPLADGWQTRVPTPPAVPAAGARGAVRPLLHRADGGRRPRGAVIGGLRAGRRPRRRRPPPPTPARCAGPRGDGGGRR